MKITGVHEHAEYYPMLSEEQLEELAADIKENGQRDPITVTSDGILIDGRNRWEACKRLGIDPVIEIEDPKDVGSFVRSRNERRHQSTGSRAMSTALSLEHDGKRKNGRWVRGSVNGESAITGWAHRMKEAGLVIDFLPELAWDVVNGETTLDKAVNKARAERDRREQERRDEEAAKKQAMEAESYATDKFTNDPDARAWLDKKLGQGLAEAWLVGEQESIYTTKASAYGSYAAEVDKVRAAEIKRRRQEEAAERERIDVLKRSAAFLKSFISGFDTAYTIATGQHHDKQGVLNMLDPSEKRRFINIMEAMTWPKTRP